MPGIIRKRHLAALLVLIIGVMFAKLANNGSRDPSVEEYYTGWESRLGYRILLGNARHCGYWEKDTWWPFPLSKAQRAMEDKLYQRLALQNGSRVLDAGAGSGIVASYMSERGLQIEAVDMTPLHVNEANHNFKVRGLNVHEQLGDYHNLSSFSSSSLDGIYTLEAFVHADDPRQVLSEFYRVLKPGGVLVMHEYDFLYDSERLQEIIRLSHCLSMFKAGTYKKLLHQAGFEDISTEDLSGNVLPLVRFLTVLGTIPYEVMKLLRIQHRFTNVMAGAEIYRYWGQARYISVRAVKPSEDDLSVTAKWHKGGRRRGRFNSR